jgi:hypothetical protein
MNATTFFAAWFNGNVVGHVFALPAQHEGGK